MKDFPISVGTKIKRTSKMSIQTLQDAIDSIKEDEQLATTIKTIRSITDDNLKRDYKAEHLPYLNLGLFEDNIRRDDKLVSTYFMIIDVDKISTEKFNEIKEQLDQDNKVYMYFVSPSGNGLKVVYKFKEEITDPEHFNDNYLHYSEIFETEYDVETDSSTQDVSHACFFSYDPDLYLNEDAEELEVIEAVEVKNTPKKKKTKKSKGSKDKASEKGKKKKQKKIHLSTAVKPQGEGSRHWSLITAVGHFSAMGMDEKTIISLALALNNQNDPPKTEKEIIKIVKKLIEKSNRKEGEFWVLNRNEFKVHPLKYIEYLGNQGFAKVYYGKNSILVRIKNNIAEEIINENVNDFLMEYINKLDNELSIYKDIIGDGLIGKSSTYCGDAMLANLSPKNLKIKHGDSSTGYIYFKNGYVVSKKNSELRLRSYSSLEAPIWKSSMVERNFSITQIKYKQSEFEQFICNVVKNDETRFLSLCSAIGYLLHGYKDESLAKVIVTVDEKVSANSEGGTGKSLVGKAISKIKKSKRLDARNFEFSPKFTFQDVDVSTEVLEFNDAQQSFDFEKLFSVTTDDMKIEYKSEKPITLTFDQSPKLLISTNFTIKGSGSSHKRRKFEIEFSDHYNADHTPKDDFGHNFFEDWDDEEWNRFDNFMMECLMLYLDEGLIDYQKINLIQRQLIAETSKDFIEFIDSYLVLGVEQDKRLFYEAFSNHIGYEPYDCPYQKRTVTSWIETYANYKEYKYSSRESNGKYYFKISK